MSRTPLPALVFHLFLLAAFAAFAPAALAQDPEAPTQTLATDPSPPTPIGAVTLDPVGMAFGEWTARFELGLSPSHALFLEGGYRSTAPSAGVALELGYHLYPLGEGVAGPFIGPSVGAAITTDRAVVSLFGALEAGWQLVLGPFALGLSGGVEAHLGFDQGATVTFAPRISVSIGYALR